jgi:hypothetical protein
VARSDFGAYLSAGAGFYDATKTNTTLEEAGLADKNDRVSDYFKSDSADAVTRPSYSPLTTYWDPAYIPSNGSQYLGAAIAHEGLHGYIGITDDDIKRAFFGSKAQTGTITGTRAITDYIAAHLQ